VRQVAAGGGTPRARTAAGGNRCFEPSLQTAIHGARDSRLAQCFPNLVKDLVLSNDRAFQTGGDSDQMPNSLLARLNLEWGVQVRPHAEPV
jgi:hypothetical protein